MKRSSQKREITNRNTGISMEMRIKKVNQVTIGWLNYFKVAKARKRIEGREQGIRRRIRACIWKQWKKIRTRYTNLRRLGLPKSKAWEYANTRKGYWRISNNLVVSTTLENQYLEELGYKSMTKRYQLIH